MAARDSTAFRALSDVVLAIAAEHEVEPVLQQVVDSARELAGARYAALGIPDGEGNFACFITSGMGDELIAALYLTEKEDADEFSAEDQKLIELLAAHAAIAIANARLYERSRELSIVEERNRLARELHDAVTQQLFGVALAAESASTLLARDREAAAAELRRGSALAPGAMEELRAVVFELRPGSLEAEGLGTVLRKHVEVLRRVSGQAIDLRVGEVPRLSGEAAAQVLRIAQEALGNAMRHAG